MSRPRIFQLPIARSTLKQVKTYIGPLVFKRFMQMCYEHEVRPSDLFRSVVMAWLADDAMLLKIVEKYEPANAVEE